jgi:hypothetical protein
MNRLPYEEGIEHIDHPRSENVSLDYRRIGIPLVTDGKRPYYRSLVLCMEPSKILRKRS